MNTVDPVTFGFSPDASGLENSKALQQALDQKGTVVVDQPGTYALAATVTIRSDTTLEFGPDVFLKKVPEAGEFCHVLLNRGALTKTWDQNIVIRGMQVMVNGVDCRKFDVYGLHGQLAFFYARHIRIEKFRCLDLEPQQYGIHVCTFEDLVVDDVIIHGMKDGVHLGRGKGFVIRNGIFKTFDDAVALNGHDYAVGNPELGWIEDGLVENCRDLDAEETTGFFCRILAGAWTDWKKGMEVQQGDTVVSHGRMYRVQAEPDGTFYKSTTPPAHETGQEVLDGIPWGMVQKDVTYTAGVRNVMFRTIALEKARTAFSIHFDSGRYSRSYYPGAPVPVQGPLVIEDVQVLHDRDSRFLTLNTPANEITVRNSSLANTWIRVGGNGPLTGEPELQITLLGCTFHQKDSATLFRNEVEGKNVLFKVCE